MLLKRLLQWAQKIDERDLSDEGRYFATEVSKIMQLPTNLGEWQASMEVAFNAGQQFERFRFLGSNTI